VKPRHWDLLYLYVEIPTLPYPLRIKGGGLFCYARRVYFSAHLCSTILLSLLLMKGARLASLEEESSFISLLAAVQEAGGRRQETDNERIHRHFCSFFLASVTLGQSSDHGKTMGYITFRSTPAFDVSRTMIFPCHPCPCALCTCASLFANTPCTLF